MEKIQSIYSPKILVLGGGGGAPSVAVGIAEENPYALVTVAQGGFDHGGASGKQRDAYGTAAAGDSRGAIAALSPLVAEKKLFSDKLGQDATVESVSAISDQMFDSVKQRAPEIDEAWLALQMDEVDALAADFVAKGNSLKGHNWGNLQLTAVAHESGSMNHAVKVGSIIMGLAENHVVLQTSDTPTDIVLHDFDRNGKEFTIVGEGDIDEHIVNDPYNAHVSLVEPVEITKELAGAIEEADVIVIAPGSKFTSVDPSLLAEGTPAALANMKATAKIIALSNLAEDGVVASVDARTFVTKLDALTNPDGTGRNVDGIMFNNAPEKLPQGVAPVVYDAHDLDHLAKTRVVIGDNLVSEEVVHRDANDLVVARSAVHHHGRRIGRLIHDTFLVPMQADVDLAS